MIRRKRLAEHNQSQITFVLPADYPHLPISVVGEFNGWNPTAHPLHPQRDGTYSTTVTLDNGRRYAFRYLSSSGEWFNEGMADAFEPNGFGRDNSILIV